MIRIRYYYDGLSCRVLRRFPSSLSTFRRQLKTLLFTRLSGPPEHWTSSMCFFKFLFGAVPVRHAWFHIGQRRAAGNVVHCWLLHVDNRHPGQLGHRPGLRPWQRAREDMLCVTGHSELGLLCSVVDEDVLVCVMSCLIKRRLIDWLIV